VTLLLLQFYDDDDDDNVDDNVPCRGQRRRGLVQRWWRLDAEWPQSHQKPEDVSWRSPADLWTTLD